MYRSLSGQGETDLAVDPLLDARLRPRPGSPALDAGATAVDASLAYSGSCEGGYLDYCGAAPDLGSSELPTPTSLAPPEVSGSTTEGDTITTSDGSWSGADPLLYAYRWERCVLPDGPCTPIPEATEPSYTLVTDDVGAALRAVVTASNELGTTAATTEMSSAIEPAEPVEPTEPTEPSEPTEPTPTEPTEPTEPSPTEPTEPAKPIDPVPGPVEPPDPIGPSEPIDPPASPEVAPGGSGSQAATEPESRGSGHGRAFALAAGRVTLAFGHETEPLCAVRCRTLRWWAGHSTKRSSSLAPDGATRPRSRSSFACTRRSLSGPPISSRDPPRMPRRLLKPGS
jgi:outer membrane biosynthesis protein TonB